MKIPRDLPQFEDEKALIVITGKQEAILYMAQSGSLERLDAFKIPKPHYSDNEGEFRSHGGGMTLTSGSVRELKDEDIIKDFLREFKQKIKKIPPFTKIYLLTPSQVKNKIQSALPNEWKKKIQAVIEGNYYFRHPTYALKKILDAQVAPAGTGFAGKEARQIMGKFEHS